MAFTPGTLLPLCIRVYDYTNFKEGLRNTNNKGSIRKIWIGNDTSIGYLEAIDEVGSISADWIKDDDLMVNSIQFFIHHAQHENHFLDLHIKIQLLKITQKHTWIVEF